MGLTWSSAEQHRFERFTRRVGAVIRRAPARFRGAPFGSAIVDVRRRLASGTPLF